VPIGVRLIDLRRELRAETGQSLNPAQGVQAQASMDIVLDRQQRELWDAYQWPHLRYIIDMDLSAGQPSLSYPPSMPFDQISRIYVSRGPGQKLAPLSYGIRAYDVPVGAEAPQTGTPKLWANLIAVDANNETDPTSFSIQFYPLPDADMTVRFEGQAPCTTLSADADVCIIDSKAIVLFAAAEVLAQQKNEAAALKLTKAQNYLRRILQNQGADKRASYNMGGNHRVDHLALRPYSGARAGIDYIP
jgi:hypothetical protein